MQKWKPESEDQIVLFLKSLSHIHAESPHWPLLYDPNECRKKEVFWQRGKENRLARRTVPVLTITFSRMLSTVSEHNDTQQMEADLVARAPSLRT